MTRTEALESLKYLVTECNKEEPSMDMNEVVVCLVQHGEDYLGALNEAIEDLALKKQVARTGDQKTLDLWDKMVKDKENK
jgi:hypothetical protein